MSGLAPRGGSKWDRLWAGSKNRKRVKRQDRKWERQWWKKEVRRGRFEVAGDTASSAEPET